MITLVQTDNLIFVFPSVTNIEIKYACHQILTLAQT